MKKIILPVAMLFLTASALTGCATPPEGSTKVDGYGGDASIAVKTVVLNSGRTVECVTIVGSSKAGITCDWENAK